MFAVETELSTLLLQKWYIVLYFEKISFGNCCNQQKRRRRKEAKTDESKTPEIT